MNTGHAAPLLAMIDRLGEASAGLAALALVGLTALMLLEIFFRFASGFIDGMPAGMPHAWEYSAWLMGIAFMAGAALTLRSGAHIRVTVLSGVVPAGILRALEIVTSLIGLALTGFLAWSLILFTHSSYLRGQTSMASDTPVWIPQSLLCLGAVIFALQMFARLVRAVLGHAPDAG